MVDSTCGVQHTVQQGENCFSTKSVSVSLLPPPSLQFPVSHMWCRIHKGAEQTLSSLSVKKWPRNGTVSFVTIWHGRRKWEKKERGSDMASEKEIKGKKKYFIHCENRGLHTSSSHLLYCKLLLK